MISRGDAERSLTGVWRIFLNKPDALRFLDTSADGFWRSFGAIMLVAPLYAITALADWRDMHAGSLADDKLTGGSYFVAKLLTLGLDWVTLPALLGLVAGLIGIRRGYPAYVVARNWGTVLTIIPFAGIAVLDLLGILGPGLLFLPSIVALAAALRFSYLVARQTLGVGMDVAIGLVALDFLVSLALVTVIDQIFGVPQFAG
ncbi:hypothetical protein BH10PSE9_BH10PSE9_18710 [soil metagenome]